MPSIKFDIIKMKLEADLHLDVPFSQRNSAKAKGAKPLYQDGKFKCWYVPSGSDVTPFMDWWPSTMRVELGGEPEPDPKSLGVSLHTYLTKIQHAVSTACSGSEWVTAEITNITGTHHKYFELSEYDAGGTERAKVRAALWASKRGLIDKFAEQAGMPLAKNMKVLVKVRAEYDPKYGLSLHIEDIDASYSIGEMEAKLNRIRSQLQSKGLYQLNKRTHLPADFFRVAVIAPEGAAGLGDFLTQSQVIQKYGLCSFDFFYATFQGPSVVSTMTRSLSSVVGYQESNGFMYDCVCIIRGGGDKAGLYALNEYEIAELVSTMPIPVITGIGHERDTTILDEVSYLSLPTPSMVVGHIMSSIVNRAYYAEEMKNKLTSASESVVARAEAQLDQMWQRAESQCALILERAQSSLDMQYQQLFSNADQKITEAENQAKDLYRRLLVNNPISVLERGYSIVKQNGVVIGSSSNLAVGDASIKMQDGERKIQVME